MTAVRPEVNLRADVIDQLNDAREILDRLRDSLGARAEQVPRVEVPSRTRPAAWSERRDEWRDIQGLLDKVAPGHRVPPALLGEGYEYAIEPPTPRPTLTLIRGGLDEKGGV